VRASALLIHSRRPSKYRDKLQAGDGGIPATSSEFFATDLVAIAITNEKILRAFGDKPACET